MEGKREVQEGEDMGIFMADSCCCMPETNRCKAVLLQFFFKKILSLYWDLKGRNRDSRISRGSEYF